MMKNRQLNIQLERNNKVKYKKRKKYMKIYQKTVIK